MKLRGYRRRAFICHIVGHMWEFPPWFDGPVVSWSKCQRCGATRAQVRKGER